MIPVTQTKFVIKDSNGDFVQRGNCYAACVASILEVPITEVPNIEVFYHLDTGYHIEVLLTFLISKGWDLCTDNRYLIFHKPSGVLEERDVELASQIEDDYYLASGDSTRGFSHVCIYKKGVLVHDPHPSREGLVNVRHCKTLERI